MPVGAPRPCNAPGCPNVTHERFCEKHKSRAWRDGYDRHRPSAAIRGFGHAWRRLREVILTRDPICVNPFDIEGHVEPATEVDHIIPVRNGGTEAESNLQGLCKPCHSRKTAIEVGFNTQGG